MGVTKVTIFNVTTPTAFHQSGKNQGLEVRTFFKIPMTLFRIHLYRIKVYDEDVFRFRGGLERVQRLQLLRFIFRININLIESQSQKNFEFHSLQMSSVLKQSLFLEERQMQLKADARTESRCSCRR